MLFLPKSFALQLATTGNLARLCPLLCGLNLTIPAAVIQPSFAIPLANALAHCSQCFVHNHLAHALFIDFYVPAASSCPAMLGHALRLLGLAVTVIHPPILALACRKLCAGA